MCSFGSRLSPLRTHIILMACAACFCLPVKLWGALVKVTPSSTKEICCCHQPGVWCKLRSTNALLCASCKSDSGVLLYTYTCICAHCAHIHVHVYSVHIYMYMRTHIHVYAHSVHIYMYMRTLRTYTCICVQCAHIHAYAYTQDDH